MTKPVEAIEPQNVYTYKSVPTKDAQAVKHIAVVEHMKDGKVANVSNSVLTLYDKFGKLVTIPPQSRGDLA